MAEENKVEEEKKMEENKEEANAKVVKNEQKKAPVKKQKVISKKEEATVKGASYPISRKHSMYLCRFIKNKSIDKAIKDLEKVISLKVSVPYKGEIPHRKNSSPGRYPVKASGYFIKLLKSLKGNCIVNGLDVDKALIVTATASGAFRPMRSGGRAAKRTTITLIAKEKLGGKN